MKSILTKALIFIAGAGIGGVAGWFASKKTYEKKMDAEIEKQVEETKTWYKDLINKTEDELKKEWEADVDDIVEKVVNDNEDNASSGHYISGDWTERMNKRKEEFINNPLRTRYDKVGAEEVQETVDEEKLKENDDNPVIDIYAITPEQFATECRGYDKVDLYWWETERILSEEDYDILDVPDLLGMTWEGKIGEFEKDTVYIRNEPMETDYVVHVRHDSFYEMRGD